MKNKGNLRVRMNGICIAIDKEYDALTMSGPIVILFSEHSPEEFLLKDTSYRASYMLLAQLAEERGLDLRFVLGENHYKKGYFLRYWRYANESYQLVEESFKAQMVYLKAKTKSFEKETRVNDSFLEKVCRDKLLTARLLPDLVKKTEELNAANLAILREFKGDLVVLKPRFGESGNNVQVISKNKITPDILQNDSYIVQEFIDSSRGIPGILTQRHELRLFIFDGELHSAYFRLPAPDSYLSNISHGATVRLVNKEDVPASALAVKKEVDAKFKLTSPRLYSIDIMYENARPWVVELNDQPGLPDVSVQPLATNYLNSLLDLLSNSSV